MTTTFSDLVGKPFAKMGRGPDQYDCWGVVIEVARRVGKTVPDYELYACDTYGENNRLYQEHVGEYVRVYVPEPGDIVVWKRISDGGLHFGAMVDGDRFLTTNPHTGVCVNRLSNPLVKQLVEGVYRCR